MVIKPFIKDPCAVLDYAFNWATNWLEPGDTIVSHTITVPTGITKDSDSESAGIVTVWLSGGTAGTTYEVACEIDTTNGRTDERTIAIICNER